MGLFDFLRKNDSPATLVDTAIRAQSESKALEAVGRIIRSEELKQVAQESRYDRVRSKAIERITDQGFLRRVAIDDQVIPVKLSAVDRMSDPWLLLEVWRREKETPVFREVAARAEERAGQIVEQMSDQGQLVRFVECDSARCRRAATARIEDQELLERIALGEAGTAEDSWQRSVAIEKISDKRVLRKILKKYKAWDGEHQAAEARLEELGAK